MKDKNGFGQDQRYPIGSVVVRTRHKRNGEQRAFVKVAEPSVWRLRAVVIWELANGPIPRGMGIHHKDRNKLNDDIGNLELLGKASHLAEHRSEHDKAKRLANFAKARRAIRWTTKSRTKRTGRHPANCDCPLHKR